MGRETVIASFIMRFVKPGGGEADGTISSPALRIAVRHVQSGYERRFTCMDEAVKFIRDEIELLERE